MGNNKIYTILLIFGLISLFLVVFLICPLLKDIQKNSEDLISAKNEIATLDAQAIQIMNFKNNYQIYKLNLDKMDQLFADPNNLVDFIEFLENTASDSQVLSKISLQPSSLNSSQKSKGASQDFIIFQSSLQGSFSQVMNFIEKIEAGEYLVEIENLTIQNSENIQSVPKNNVSEDYSDRKVDATLAIKVFTKI